MTMTLEIPDALRRKLEAAAARQRTSPEDVLLKLADEHLADEAADAASHRAHVQAAGGYVQKKNAELYERLA